MDGTANECFAPSAKAARDSKRNASSPFLAAARLASQTAVRVGKEPPALSAN